MVTVREYIRTKMSNWGIAYSDVYMLSSKGCINPDEAVTQSNIRSVELHLLSIIAEMLLAPSSISELGVSISKSNMDAVMAYYKYKCKELGVKDVLSKPKPRVRFL